MIGFFKKKSSSINIYSEENAFFSNVDITDFYDYRTDKKSTLSYLKAYQIGKEMYEKKFGDLVGSDLKKIKSNIFQVYADDSLQEKNDQDLEPADIGNVITHLGKNAWLMHHHWTDFKKSYRIDIGVPKEMVSDAELKDFFSEYSSYENQYSKKPSKLIILNSMKKEIQSYIDGLIKDKYDEKSKRWNDFEITYQFLEVRTFMIDTSNPIQSYVWNLIDGNPFYKIYRVCRDYMKWNKSLSGYKSVFKNVCDWEIGTLFRKNESQSKFEEGLWINWNKVGKDFLSSKSVINEMDGGLEWLKGEFTNHIERRKNYYDQLSDGNEHIISDDLIQKIKGI
jgi:hypothetical protein